MPKPRRPRDTNQLAKLIVDISVGEAQDAPAQPKNQAAVELGRLGGRKGGAARAKLPPEERIALAKRAAQARWAKSEPAAALEPARKKKRKISL